MRNGKKEKRKKEESMSDELYKMTFKIGIKTRTLRLQKFKGRYIETAN